MSDTIITTNSYNDPYLINKSRDNNFYVSYKVLRHIENRQEDGLSLSNEEIQILAQYEERKSICKNKDIHYWIIPYYTNPERAECHFCNIAITQYNQDNRKEV